MNNVMDFWRSEWMAVTNTDVLFGEWLPTANGVQYYTHPDKKQFLLQKNKAIQKFNSTKQQYIDYYTQIGRLGNQPTEDEIWNVFSDANRAELQRLQNLAYRNQVLYKKAVQDEQQWNKLDSELYDVVNAFNNMKKYKETERLDPNLLKALLFSETEIGAGEEYRQLVENVPINNPKAVYQLNLGRVTDANVYNAVVKEFNIKVSWRTNYLDMGNKNDVKLAAGALILKSEYAQTIGSPLFVPSETWYNAVIAYKGISSEGKRKANLVWNLYRNGVHPYNTSKKLF